jgi:hypothetical protein
MTSLDDFCAHVRAQLAPVATDGAGLTQERRQADKRHSASRTRIDQHLAALPSERSIRPAA